MTGAESGGPAPTGPTERPPGWFSANVATAAHRGVVTHDDVRLCWYRWGGGGGPPLVLVHGAAANAAWWSPIAPFLAVGRPVVAVELSGMGDSGWRANGYRIESWADEVVVATDAALAELSYPAHGRVMLVGHSLGASVAAAAAARHPDRFSHVVLCDLGLAPTRSTPRATARGGTPRQRAERAGRHFTNRILYASEAEARSRFSLVPRQSCPNPWMISHVAQHSVRPVGAGGVGDPTRPPPGEAIGWSWKFDWRLFARGSQRPLTDYLAELGRRASEALDGTRVSCVNGSISRVATAAAAEQVRQLARPDHTVWIADAAHHLMLDQPLAFVAALGRGLSLEG